MAYNEAYWAEKGLQFKRLIPLKTIKVSSIAHLVRSDIDSDGTLNICATDF